MVLAAVNGAIMLLRFTEQCLLARALGADQRLDAYFLGQVVMLLGAQAAVAVTSTAIPILAEVGESSFRATTRRLLLAATPAVILALSLMAVLSGPIIGALGGKFDSANMHLARAIFLWLLPATAASIVAGLLRAYWYARRDFILPGVGQLFMPLCTCAGAALVALGVWNLLYAAAVANIGAFALLAVLYRPLWGRAAAERSKTIPTESLKGVVGRFSAALLPVGAGLALLPAMIAASRFFASSLAAGSVTAVSLAASLASIPGQFAAASVGMVLLPQTSLFKAAGRMVDAARMIERALCNTAFVAIPCAVVLALWPQEVVDIVFRRGAFDRAAVGLTASALSGFSYGVPVQAGVQVLVFALFALLGTRQVGIMAVATLLFNLVLSRMLLPFGVLGVGSAFTIACWVDSAVLLWLLAKSLPELRVRQLLGRHFRILAISAFAGAAGRLLGGCLDNSIEHPERSFFLKLALMAAIYLGINLLIASPEMQEVLDTVRSRLARRTTGEALSAGD